MEILSNEANVDIISWLPHGKGFMIFQKKRFASEILPKYFKKSKFTSFTRKLNRWNFTRVTRGPETGAYYHECFQKGNLRLCMQMSCQNPKSQTAQLQLQQQQAQQLSSSTTSALARLGISGGPHMDINSLQAMLPGGDSILFGQMSTGVGDENQLNLQQFEQPLQQQ